uniref:Uncharacterized protein n=1 Tax=Onchocerca volvulus TaxID=6282 RepID=A0A8R1TXT7_ONCVO
MKYSRHWCISPKIFWSKSREISNCIPIFKDEANNNLDDEFATTWCLEFQQQDSETAENITIVKK